MVSLSRVFAFYAVLSLGMVFLLNALRHGRTIHSIHASRTANAWLTNSLPHASSINGTANSRLANPLPHASNMNGTANSRLPNPLLRASCINNTDPAIWVKGWGTDDTDFFSVDLGHGPAVPCGAEPSWAVSDGVRGKTNRAAIVLRGENFRPKMKHPKRCHSVRCNPAPQLDILRTFVRDFVVPLEEHGFETDMVVLAYPSPFNSLIKETLIPHLKVFATMNWTINASQGSNAYSSMSLLVQHARKERIWYTYVVLCRMDVGTRGSGFLRRVLASHPPPSCLFLCRAESQGHTWLVQRFLQISRVENDLKCVTQDFVQAMSGTAVGCFLDMMYYFRHTPVAPFFPVECIPSFLWPSMARTNGSFEVIDANLAFRKGGWQPRCPTATWP